MPPANGSLMPAYHVANQQTEQTDRHMDCSTT